METVTSSSVTPERVDAHLVQQLNRMSFQEREIINEEIHGVRSLAVEETPEFVQQKLVELDRALTELPDREKTAYLEAVRFNSLYVVNQEKLRLPILRAEVFDARKAATRLAKFLDLVLDLYGHEALMRPITLADFNSEDINLMKQGLFQMLPGRDRTGRRIMGHFADIPTEFSVRSRVSVACVCCGLYECLKVRVKMRMTD